MMNEEPQLSGHMKPTKELIEKVAKALPMMEKLLQERKKLKSAGSKTATGK